MMSRLQDRVAVVTGAGSGIGRASALAFAEEGARVVVVDLVESAAEETVRLITEAAGEAVPFRADVTSERDAAAMVEAARARYGPVTVLFNNAGGGSDAPVIELSEKTWTRMVNLNLKSVYLGCKHALPGMVEAGGGSIVSTASVLANVAMPGLPSYSAAKAGVIALTRQIALEYASQGVRVNCICPGWIFTRTVEETFERAPDPDAARASAIESIPLGRFGREEDVARAAVFLASRDSAFITGVALTIDGGFTLK